MQTTKEQTLPACKSCSLISSARLITAKILKFREDIMGFAKAGLFQLSDVCNTSHEYFRRHNRAA
jgi:hypothetical protein